MPFISGPTDSSSIPIETDAGVKEFDAFSSGGTIKTGTPIEMTDIFKFGNANTLTGIDDYSHMVGIGDGKILAYSSYSNKLYLFELSDDMLNISASADIPSALKLQSGEYNYSTTFALEVISNSSAVLVKSSNNGIFCSAVSFTHSNISIGTPYTLSSSSRMNRIVVVKLDNTHVLIPNTIQINGTYIETYPVFNVLSISGTVVNKESSIQMPEESSGGYMEMYKMKDYVLVAWHPDSSYSSTYHACLKFKNNSISICGAPTVNAVIADDPYVSENTLYTFKSVDNGSEGYQITCSDSGLDANYSYVYLLYSQISSGNEWHWPDCTPLKSTSIGNINITKNMNIHVGQFSGYEAYVIFKDSVYRYAAESTGYWKSLVLYRQFIYNTSVNRYHGTYPRFSIDDTHVFASNFGDSSAGTLTYVICTIKPTVKASTYIADGIATTDITPSSGKCAIF